MKKFAALLLAVLTLTGCSPKKSSDIEPPVENDDKAVEEEMRVYNKDEFRRVELDLHTEQKDVGIQLKEMDITGFDFGEKLSPCKTADDPYVYKSSLWDGDSEKYDRLFEESLTAPAKGFPVDAVLDGEDIYIYVSYDPYCADCHSFAIYRLDAAAGEVSGFYSAEKIEGIDNVTDYQIADGRLFRQNHESVEKVYIDPETGEEQVYYAYVSNEITEIDTETGEESLFYSTDNNIYLFYIEDRIIHIHEDAENGMVSRRIDISSGEDNMVDLSQSAVFPTGSDGSWWTEITDGTKSELDLVTENFRLSTGLRTFSKAFIRGNKASILVFIGNMGYADRKLYTYDLDTMEVYVTDVTSLGNPYERDGNLLFVKTDDNVFKVSYFVPEIGTAFEVEYMNNAVDYVGLNTGARLYCVRSIDEFKSGNFSVGDGYIEKLIWID